MLKKIQRILALLGAILLVVMYVLTLVAALSKSENANAMLEASVYATIIVPVLIYAYTLIYRLLKNKGEEIAEQESSDKDKH